MKLNIKSKLLIGFILLLALSSLVQALTFSIAGDLIYSQKKDLQTAYTVKEIDKIGSFLIQLNEINYALTKIYKINSITGSASAQTALASSINTYLLKNKQIDSISLVSSKGDELLKVVQNKGLLNQNNLIVEPPSAVFNSAISGHTAFSDPYISKTNPGTFLNIYTPVIITQKVPLVLKTQVNLHILNHMLISDKVGQNGLAYVVDNKGLLIAHTDSNFALERPDLTSRKIISTLLNNKNPSPQEEKYKNEKNIIVTSKAAKIPGLNWIVVFEEPLSEVLSFTDFMRSLFIVTFVGSLIVLLIIALFLSDNLTRPIRELQNFTQLLEKGQHKNLKITTGDEIEALSGSFNSMAVQLLQREENLKKQKQEKEIILQNLSDGIIVVDSENKITLYNKEAGRITGINPAIVFYKNIDEILKIYDQDKLITFNQVKILLKETMLNLNNMTRFFVDSAGTKIKISLVATPVISDDLKNNSWVITIHDMRKEQELEEMKIDFVSMAAHELRTPLTAIRGYTSLLQNQTGLTLDPANKELFNRLMISTEKLSDLIDNLLNISRIERDSFRIVIRPVDITGVINNIVNGLRPEAYALNQKIEIDHSIQSLPKVMADPFRISQVLSHLITNAINYTLHGGNIIIKAGIRDNFVEISVIDNGIGIPEESIPNIFTKFYRVIKPNEIDSKGPGLGLFICKSIIDMHKGKISVKSEINKGSEFTFTLPLASET